MSISPSVVIGSAKKRSPLRRRRRMPCLALLVLVLVLMLMLLHAAVLALPRTFAASV